MTELLRLREDRRNGICRGMYSVCSAHPLVLRAAMEQSLADGTPVLIEATCNQVDQFGGYTGMTPVAFTEFVRTLALEVGFPEDRLILGGDHLGPNPWRGESAQSAMLKAEDLVDAYVAAGFQKIHLDASMHCADDPSILADTTIAERAARLCLRAEQAYQRRGSGSAPVYVIGTEVPTPGGTVDEAAGLQPTSAADVIRTLEISQAAFRKNGLEAAWERVIALVVQPGVEFGDTKVHGYDRQLAQPLVQAIATRLPWMYEAHSTDYQTPLALQQLVQDRFAMLKVGPWLTFALREALFSLEDIVRDLNLADRNRPLARLREVLDFAMRSNPVHWKDHHRGSSREQALARLFSFSDRSRYYWNHPEVCAEVAFLLETTQDPIPLQLLSQHAPAALGPVMEGSIQNNGQAIVLHAIRRVLSQYSAACRPRTLTERVAS